jgi:class 3 adenylate cyclase
MVQRERRRLAAIVAADVAGYSRLMERDARSVQGGAKMCKNRSSPSIRGAFT